MDKLYITHYFYPGTDPWKNIMILPEEDAFRKAEELANAHPDTTSFGRFADFENYYPARKKADQFVREKFIQLGGKIIIDLDDVPDDQVSFTLGDSCALMIHGNEPVVLTKKMLYEHIEACNGSVDVFLKESLGNYAYVEVQLWDKR